MKNEEKSLSRKKVSKSSESLKNSKNKKKNDNTIKELKEKKEISSIKDIKNSKPDETPKNANHIGAPIKGNEKKEKPKSGWWNKG